MKVLLTLMAVLTAIAVAAPAAFSAPKPQGYTIITDTLGGNWHARQAQQQATGYRFVTDTLGGNGGAPLTAYVSSSGFSWTDAGVGAVTLAGSVLVLLGGARVVLRKRGLVF